MAELTPEGATLVAALDRFVLRGRVHGMVRGLAIGALPGAALVGTGHGAPGLGVAALGGLLGLVRSPGRAVWARRLDAFGGLADACACALDHATAPTPVHRAQARRALAGVAACPPGEVAPRPSVLWGAPILALLAALGLSPPAHPASDDAAAPDAPSAASEPGTRAGHAAAPSSGGDSAAEAPATGAPGLASTAPESGEQTAGPPPEPGAQGSRADPPEGSEGKAAGVGARAGELAGGRLRPVDAAEVAAGPARALDVARGAGELKVDAGPGAPVGGLPSARDDAFSDPARPFPAADAPLISAYFDRRRPSGRAVAPPVLPVSNGKSP
jgi:hypothetical protein